MPYVQIKQKYQVTIPRNPSLLSLSGINKDSGLYASASEADAYIDTLRDEWK